MYTVKPHHERKHSSLRSLFLEVLLLFLTVPGRGLTCNACSALVALGGCGTHRVAVTELQMREDPEGELLFY